MHKLLELQNISLTYQAKNSEIAALESITMTAQEGELIAIVGPSGCGKSTLLSVIAGLEHPTYGQVWIDGQTTDGISEKIGYMLQKDNLLDWRSIRGNVLLGLEIRDMLSKENIDYADSLLETYGLSDFCKMYPTQLSGGMRQRVALIRTLATRPALLLLDEAFSALDYQTRLKVTDDVYRILKRENKTALMVTHDIPESISMADRVIILSERPGTIRHDITLDFPSEGSGKLPPLARRGHPNFSEYFNLIWKELDRHG